MSTLWTRYQTPAFFGAFVYALHDINQFLLVIDAKIQLVVVSRPEIAHHVLVVEEEKHGKALLVQLVVGFEIRHLVRVAQVDHGPFLDQLFDLLELVVHLYRVGMRAVSEADDDQPWRVFALVGRDRLVNVPA